MPTRSLMTRRGYCAVGRRDFMAAGGASCAGVASYLARAMGWKIVQEA